MALNDLICRSAKAEAKARKLTDAKSLYLYVTPAGAKVWRFNYRFDGKQKTLVFGHYPEVSLATARGLRDKARDALAEGRNPATQESAEGTARTFKEVAEEWLKSQSVAWVADHFDRITSRFVKDVYPHIGAKRIDAITAPEVLSLIRLVEGRGALDVSRRIRQSISQVFRYAIAAGECEIDPAAHVGAALKARPRVKHMPAIREPELPTFFQRLRAYDGERQTCLAIEFVVHTFVRTKEVRFARWSEFKGNLWRIPAERMKMGKEHLVPLTPKVLSLLVELRKIAGDSEWVVPGARGKPISENTMLFALYRMGYHSRATIHGFRSTASTILNESGLWGKDAIERQLSHVDEDEVRSAYNAALYLDERTKMMHWYSNLLMSKDGDLSELLS